jgi:hypothetical protein
VTGEVRFASLATAVLAAVLLVVAAAQASATAGAGVRTCRPVTVTAQGKPYGYSVRIVKGTVTCTRARTVLHAFLADAAFPRGWFCARGHASQGQKWAAQCASGAGAVIRAFGPLKG